MALGLAAALRRPPPPPKLAPIEPAPNRSPYRSTRTDPASSPVRRNRKLQTGPEQASLHAISLLLVFVRSNCTKPNCLLRPETNDNALPIKVNIKILTAHSEPSRQIVQGTGFLRNL